MPLLKAADEPEVYFTRAVAISHRSILTIVPYRSMNSFLLQNFAHITRCVTDFSSGKFVRRQGYA